MHSHISLQKAYFEDNKKVVCINEKNKVYPALARGSGFLVLSLDLIVKIKYTLIEINFFLLCLDECLFLYS